MDGAVNWPGDDVLKGKASARLQNVEDLAIKRRFVRNPHLHLNGHGAVETGIVKRCFCALPL